MSRGGLLSLVGLVIVAADQPFCLATTVKSAGTLSKCPQ